MRIFLLQRPSEWANRLATTVTGVHQLHYKNRANKVGRVGVQVVREIIDFANTYLYIHCYFVELNY